MKKSLKGAVIGSLALAAGPALGGGIDRSGLGLGPLFEKGNYIELGVASVTPTVRATPNAYGDVANDYTTMSLGMKMDLNQKVSLAILVNQPYGVDINYIPVSLGAKLDSSAVTLLGRYKFSDSLSVHGGLYSATVGGTFNPAGPGPIVNIANTSVVGYVLGVAFEKPEIAARVALTWFSGTNHIDNSSRSSVNAPQNVNLDFQTGIAKDTLLFGSIRWGEWSTTKVIVATNTVATWSGNSLDYSLGVGRKFNDNWSGALTVGYSAPSSDAFAQALNPTNGTVSVGLGVTYARDSWKVSAGVQQVTLGNATTRGLPANTWTGNTATAAGIRIGYSF
jgi:long-subunit fatty acid transport protein